MSVSALVVSMTSVLAVTVPPQAAAAGALLCDQNTVYGLGGNNELTAINVNTGATTNVVSMAPANNALGLTSNGIDAWGWQNGSGTSTLVHFNTNTGAVQTTSGVDTAAPTTMIRGAINPATGIYYYASNGADAYLGAYDTGAVSGTPRAIGKVGIISGLIAGANGDFAFSSQGLLFVVTGNQIRRVDDTTPPTSAGNQALTTTLVATLDASVNSPGMTFASNGYLYVVNGSNLIKLDPADGVIQSTVPIAGGYIASDLGSCTYPNTLTAQTDIVARAFPTDEFTLTVTGGNIVANNTATTTGSTTGLQATTAGAVLVLPGSTYTVAETAPTGSTTVLSNYTTTYSCRNVTTGTDAIAGTTGTSGSFVFPSPTSSAGVDVNCVFVNTAKPALTVRAALGGNRVTATDQFTTAIRTGSAAGPVVNATTNSTTTGSGSTVTAGTGTTGRFVGAAATTYYVTDDAAGGTNLAQYARTVTCTDANGLQTSLPTAAAFTGSLAITVVDGAQVSCTVTAVPAAATLTVLAALGSPRANDSDQFTPAIHTGSAAGPVVNATTNSTSTGNGSTVTTGTGTTGAYRVAVGTSYYLTEATAGPGAALYTRAISCVDGSGVQTGLPSGAFTNQSITPVNGANIVCTVTQTGNPAALSLAKANPAQLMVGTPAAYTLTATNSGGAAAGSARILDRLPANLQYTSGAGSGWTCTVSGDAATGQLVDCAFTGSIAPLGASTLTVTVTPLTGAAGTSTLNRAAVGVTPGATPVDPDTCTATGDPAGCAVPTTVPIRLVTASDDTATTTPGTAVSTAVLANDSVTPDGSLNPASVTVSTAGGHGTTTVNTTTGAITYTPTNGFSGADSYRYQVCDRSAPTPVCASATVAVTVPNTVTANNDTASTGQNTAVPVSVLSNDTVSTDGSPLNPDSVVVVSGPAHGSTTVATGVITYSPSNGYSGSDAFVYRVCDSSIPMPVCATATVTTTVGINTVSAGPDSAATPPGTAVRIDVLDNDTSGTGQPLGKPTVTAGPGHGSTSVDPSTRDIVYTPTDGSSGVDTFTYTVCDTSNPTPVCASALVTVTVPNDVTANGDDATTPQNIAVTTAVLTNDTVSPDGAALDPASVTVSDDPAHGTATVLGSGEITYTPNPGYSGSDDYRYSVCDLSTPTPTCASALVVVLVGANTVVAADEDETTPPVTAVTVPVLDDATSSTGQPLTDPTIASEPGHGIATVNDAGAVVYTPAAGFSGVDAFTYSVCDTSTPTPVCDSATITITVPTDLVVTDDSAVTDQNTPVESGVLANDTVPTGAAPLDPASVIVGTAPLHGTTTVNSETGAVTYSPATNYNGPDSYRYTVCDTSTPTPVCASATVTLSIRPNVITVTADSATVAPATPVEVALLANDTVTPGGAPLDPATVAIGTAPAHGTVTVDPTTGTATYTPAGGFSGVDTFTYSVCDRSVPTPVCGSAITTVNVPDTVTAVADTATATQNTQIRIPVLANDTITAGAAPLNPASVTVTGAPTHGTATVDPATGDVLYTPDLDYAGPDGFSYRVCDGSTPTPVCATGTVTISIPADTVTAVNDTDRTVPLIPVTTNVLLNDTVSTGGAPLNPAAVTVPAGPAHGTVVVDPDTGAITYTPGADFSGVDIYRYTVCDTSVPTPVCASATVTIIVATVVVAIDDVAAVKENTAAAPSSITTPVLANDSVTPGAAPLNPASVTIAVTAAHGTTVIDSATGAITYTPTVGYAGSDRYTYGVCDSSSPTPVCVTADVTIVVGTNAVAANADVATTAPTRPVSIDVRRNDSTSTGQPLANPTVTNVPDHGTAVVHPITGDVTYTPADGFSGVDVFRYQVCDTSTPTPVCASADVAVTVPSPFRLIDDKGTTAQNTPVTTDVLANDTVTTGGAPLNPASVAVTVQPLHGSTSVDRESGAVTYTPSAGYSGPDSYNYVVCDGSMPVPVCGSAQVTLTVGANTVTVVGDSATTLEGTPTTMDVIGNDTVSTGGAPLDPASVTVPTGPTHGTATVDPTTGVITYTPEAGYSGPDSFTYQVCDSSTPTPVCGTATVQLSVLRTGLALLKTASVADSNGDGVVGIGDTISYRFAVSNTGETTVSNIVVVDDKAGETACPRNSLMPDEDMECVAVNDHVITDADAAAGGVTNSAFVQGSGSCPDGSCEVSSEILSEAGIVVTPISGDAQLAVTKTGRWTDADGDGVADVGEHVSWVITVTNPGTEPATALAVSDPAAGPVTCADVTVVPGASVGCTVADTVLSPADISTGSVTNTASATGNGPSGPVTSLMVTAIVLLPAGGHLSYTGFAGADMLWIALLLTALGASLLLIGKRRRQI